MSNKLVTLARKILAVEADLPFRFRCDTEERRSEKPDPDDFEYIIYDETFPDTSFGLGGMGGRMLVTAPVIVAFPVTTAQPAFVYFNGQFAYEADPANENFRNDLHDQHLVYKHESGKYKRIDLGDSGMTDPLYSGIPYGHLVSFSGVEHR